MPLLLGTKGKEILQWRACTELVNNLEARLARKWGRSSAREAEGFVAQFIEALDQELGYEEQYLRETAALDRALEAADDMKQLGRLQQRYRELVCAYFRRRQSVLALNDACNALNDRLLERALAQARERMLQLGQGEAPQVALLVSGDRGRGESTLYSHNRYFLLHQEENPSSFLFSRQVATALGDVGLLEKEMMFWHGTVAHWRALLKESFPLKESGDLTRLLAAIPPFAAPLRQGPQQMPEWAWRFEALADLSPAGGAVPLAAEALEAAALALDQERNRPPFLQLARKVIGLPLAVGRFGGWRLERDGEHRGELNLDEFALGPLVMTLRILAVHADIHTVGTVQRIGALLDRGALDVDLAGRLLRAYQCFMRMKVLSEIRSEEGGSHCNPDEFDEAESARFKNALESVLNLQKIAYQRLVGQV